MPVEFANFHFNDHGRPLTVENAFRFYGAWAGLHDFQFDRLFDAASVEMTGVSATGWTVDIYDTEIPTEHTVYYSTSGGSAHQGVIVGATSDDDFYLVCTEGTGTLKIYKAVGGVMSLVFATDFAGETGTGDYVCTYRPFVQSGNEEDIWIAISLWRDERHLISYSEPVPDDIIGPFYFGLAAYGTQARTYTDVYVPELTVYAEYGTLDPGESAIGGLMRSIEGRNLRFFSRYNGTIRAFRSKDVEASRVFTNDDVISSRVITFDLKKVKTHIRMMGAYTWGESADANLISLYGHRFLETNNPMLMSETDCIDEAQRLIRRMRSEAETCDLEVVNLPAIELHDRIDEPEDGSWLVSGYNKRVEPGAIMTTYMLRRYIEE